MGGRSRSVRARWRAVAVSAVIAAPLSGKLADRYGAVRVMRIMLLVFGVGLWIPTFSRDIPVLLAVLPVVGMGGAMAFALPYAILMKMMPRESHGAAAGLFDVSGGAGALLGPLVTGGAIDVLNGVSRPERRASREGRSVLAVEGTFPAVAPRPIARG